MPRGQQNTIELAFQSLNPRAQSRGASDSKADEQMNVTVHEQKSSYVDAKVGRTPAMFDAGLLHFGRGK